MPKYEPVVKIDKHDEVGYRILNGLKVNREYLIKDGGLNKRSLLINIGRSTRSLKPKHPVVWHSADHVKDNGIRLLKLPPGIEIEEEHGNNKIFFRFKRRQII